VRQGLWSAFADGPASLAESGLAGELWINGSFLTEKRDPGDIDVVLRISGEVVDNATDSQAVALEAFLNSEDCHAFFVPHWPKGHKNYDDGEELGVYWQGWWGSSRSGDSKGHAVIQFGGGQNV